MERFESSSSQSHAVPQPPKDSPTPEEPQQPQQLQAVITVEDDKPQNGQAKPTYAQAAARLKPSAKVRPRASQEGSNKAKDGEPVVLTWDVRGALDQSWDEVLRESTDDAFWEHMALATQTATPRTHDACSFIGYGDRTRYDRPETKTKSKQYAIEVMLDSLNERFGQNCPGGRVLQPAHFARQKTGVRYWSKKHQVYTLLANQMR